MAPMASDPGTLARRAPLRECVYCGKFTRTPMDHGPGRCWTPPPDWPPAAVVAA